MPALLLTFVIATIAGTVLTPMVIRMAVTWGIFDAPPGGRRIHTEPLPRLGGIAVFLALAASIIITGIISLTGLISFGTPPRFLFGVLVGGGLVFFTGLVDDLRGLRPMAKFVAQVIAALIVYSYGFQIHSLSIGSSAELPLGIFALPVTVLWIVGVTNAFNLIDGLDGLATGIAVVALATTTSVAIVLGNTDVVFLSVAMLGALLGFLKYNFNPARIFLGDSGSLFVGFMLAVLSVYGSQKAATAVVVLAPVFALAVPLLDTGLSILRRWLRGVPLSQADGRHIHHRLLALGFTHRHAVLVMYVAASVLAVLGLSLIFAPPPAVASVAAAGGGLTFAVLLYGLRWLQYHEFLEAGSVVISGLTGIRRVIRDQIYAQDVAEVVLHAEAMEELNAILNDNATTFGFLHMEVCQESATGPRPLVLFNGHAARAWKLDYPVTPHDFVEDGDYVLRIWCNPQTDGRLYNAERIAKVLAPRIQEWITRTNEADTTDDTAVEAVNGWVRVGSGEAEVARITGRRTGTRWERTSSS